MQSHEICWHCACQHHAVRAAALGMQRHHNSHLRPVWLPPSSITDSMPLKGNNAAALLAHSSAQGNSWQNQQDLTAHLPTCLSSANNQSQVITLSPAVPTVHTAEHDTGMCTKSTRRKFDPAFFIPFCDCQQGPLLSGHRKGGVVPKGPRLQHTFLTDMKQHCFKRAK
jgi:hypothetical protein